MPSHPAWVCGLKRSSGLSGDDVLGHTLRGCVDWNFKRIVPFSSFICHTLRGCVDWNIPWNSQKIDEKSHPAWVCGLKPPPPVVPVSLQSHTLRGCVDWNTSSLRFILGRFRSHPAWVCGLKLPGHNYRRQEIRVTPCVGVWIETVCMSMSRISSGSHTLRGCVDWNTFDYLEEIPAHGHTLRGCIWIEALFTRWSSLWKNCKHSASCVFLFKLL